MRTEAEVKKEAAINAAKISISHLFYGLALRQAMHERAIKFGIIFG